MTSRQTDETAREIAGRAKKEIGQATNDPELEANGLGEEVAARIEQARDALDHEKDKK